MQPHLLLLEDDPLFGETLEDFLSLQGYQVVWVQSAQEVIEVTYDTLFDVMILDINLPEGENGLNVLRLLRENKISTPAIFLTSRTDPRDAVEGFDAGCDDYLRKPCDLFELLCRLKSVMTRRYGTTTPTITLDNAMTFDPHTKQLFCHDTRQPLNPKEAQLLALFIQERKRLVTNETIFDTLWSAQQEGSFGSIRVYIANLKKILGDHAIENTRGLGYTLMI